MKKPTKTDKANLTRLRQGIDAIDEEMVRLLKERHGLAKAVAELKRNTGTQRYIPWREKQILKRVLALNAGRLPGPALTGIFRDILGLCRQTEKPLVVAYPGPEGSIAHAAARHQFGYSTQLEAAPGLSGVLERVAAREADYGVLPLETSTEGIGAHALEHFMESDLTITAEYYFKLDLCVASRSARRRPARLFVQEMIYAMNRPWIAEKFAAVPIEQGPTVAWCASRAAQEAGAAAICPPFSAEVYGLDVIAEAPGDPLGKELRFLTAGRAMPELTRSDKTTIAFSLVDRVGILEEALRIFKRRKVNLTLLDSYYPSKTLPTVTFFADFQGHATEAGIRKTIEELRKITSFVKVLGSYPVFRG